MSKKAADAAQTDPSESTGAPSDGDGTPSGDGGKAPESAAAEPSPESPAGGETPEPAESDDATLDELRQQAEDNWTRYVRAAAELDNLRRRSARELENAHKFAVERFAQAVLPVRDSIEAALAAADSADVATLLEGERATLRLLDQALESVNVREIDPQGAPFDPNKHEAMSVLPSNEAEPDSVLEVIQKGYEMNERLIRPARVIVAQDAGAGGGNGE